ncbi:hypothetical protein EDB81DRAFT_778582 [Dactylonectria macrodidyma]|uniref:Uncharacterized protein n=1 Tax=Dactylonectria macrodidyma TaxID=307937 RepID=A0A9P9JHN8_9HYPO|nr:hypothetical protein EDB81DRAFT_778582 [Dactylonectria macrodidyma]
MVMFLTSSSNLVKFPLSGTSSAVSSLCVLVPFAYWTPSFWVPSPGMSPGWTFSLCVPPPTISSILIFLSSTIWVKILMKSSSVMLFEASRCSLLGVSSPRAAEAAQRRPMRTLALNMLLVSSGYRA